MSGLAALIAGREPAGVYRWVNVADIADLRDVVEHAGFTFAHLDSWTAPDRPALLAAIGGQLAFPSYYGRNLDALADCLGDVAEPAVVIWDGWTVLAEEDRAGFDAIIEIFTERAAAVPHVSLLLRSSRASDEMGPRHLD